MPQGKHSPACLRERSKGPIIGLMKHLFALLFLSCTAFAETPHRTVILVPGVGNTGETWRDKGIVQSLLQTGRYRDAGDWRSGQTLVVPDAQEIPVFTISLSDRGQASIYESGRELTELIRLLRQHDDKGTITLVGKSIGGVVARECLTSCLYKGGVDRLISIASPHLGSELAMISCGYDKLATDCLRRRELAKGVANVWWRKPICWWHNSLASTEASLTGGLDGLLRDSPLRASAPALRMLEPPSEGNYLERLNSRPHPQDIRYTCVITCKHFGNYLLGDIAEDWRNYRRGSCQNSRFWMALSDAGRASLSLATGIRNLAGDGAVSKTSQNLNEIPAFQGDAAPKAEIVEVNAGHQDEESAINLAEILAK